jgi:TldD protein
MEDGKWLVDLLMEEGAEYAEVRHHRSTEFNMVMKNGIPEPPEYGEALGVGLRVRFRGALAFASTNLMNRENLRETGMRALRAARAIAGVSSGVGFSEEKPNRATWGVECRLKPTEVDTSTVLELMKGVDSAITSTKGASFPKRLLVFGGSVEEKVLVNSEGTELRSMVPRVEGYFIITAQEEGKGSLQRILQMGESGGWEQTKAMDPEGAARAEAEGMSKVLLEGKYVSASKRDVVVGGEVTGIIAHEACGHPQEADRILGREAAQAGESYLKRDGIGRKIGSAEVNISDFPCLDHSYGFYLYDDEGVKAEKKALIREGVISGFLHNRETAYELETKSNAAARAMTYGREPIVRMSNTFTEPGEYTLEELVEGVRDGIYIKTFQEWNIDDLRWNNRYVGLEAYAIEGGQITTPVRSPIIEATTEVIFSSVDAVGCDTIFKSATCGKGQPDQGVPVWTGGPSMRMRGLYVKSRQ